MKQPFSSMLVARAKFISEPLDYARSPLALAENLPSHMPVQYFNSKNYRHPEAELPMLWLDFVSARRAIDYLL